MLFFSAIIFYNCRSERRPQNMYKELLVYATTAVGSDSSASVINTSINTHVQLPLEWQWKMCQLLWDSKGNVIWCLYASESARQVNETAHLSLFGSSGYRCAGLNNLIRCSQSKCTCLNVSLCYIITKSLDSVFLSICFISISTGLKCIFGRDWL